MSSTQANRYREELIAVALEHHGSRRELANAVGVALSTVNRWASGSSRPSDKNWRALLAVVETAANTAINDQAVKRGLAVLVRVGHALADGEFDHDETITTEVTATQALLANELHSLDGRAPDTAMRDRLIQRLEQYLAEPTVHAEQPALPVGQPSGELARPRDAELESAWSLLAAAIRTDAIYVLRSAHESLPGRDELLDLAREQLSPPSIYLYASAGLSPVAGLGVTAAMGASLELAVPAGLVVVTLFNMMLRGLLLLLAE